MSARSCAPRLREPGRSARPAHDLPTGCRPLTTQVGLTGSGEADASPQDRGARGPGREWVVDVLPPPGAPAPRQARQARRRLRPQAPGGPGRSVRRDHRRHAVRLPVVERPPARQVPRPALRDRCGGDGPRRDARDDDRAAAREGPSRHHRGRRPERPDRGRRHRRDRPPARHRRRRRGAPGRLDGQPVERQLRDRERQHAGRLHGQRQRRDAGPPPGRPPLPHDRRRRGA